MITIRTACRRPFFTDHWRCRMVAGAGRCKYDQVLRLLQCITAAGLEVIKTENLYTFDGQPGYSMGQGE